MTSPLINDALSFYLGMLLSMLLQGQASVAAESNGNRSLVRWFLLNWVPLLAHMFVSTLILPLLIKMVPTSVTSELPLVSVYGLVGLSSQMLSSRAVFILGKQFGPLSWLAPEMPRSVPPDNGPSSPGPSAPSH